MRETDWGIKIIDKGYTTLRDIFIWRRIGGDRVEIMQGDKFVTCTDGMLQEPSMRMNPEMLQAFADALGSQGFKPQKGFLEGKIEATEKHLEDMRKLLFKGK